MENLKFGIAGLKGTTPMKLKVIYRIIMGLSAAYLIVAAVYDISVDVDAQITKAIAVSNPLFYCVCQMFGIPKELITDGEKTS